MPYKLLYCEPNKSLVGVALALVYIVDSNIIRVRYYCISHHFTITVVENSFT